jgi:hypothetical protein
MPQAPAATATGSSFSSTEATLAAAMAIAASLLVAAAATMNRSVQTSPAQPPISLHQRHPSRRGWRPRHSGHLQRAPTTDRTLDSTSGWMAYRKCSMECPYEVNNACLLACLFHFIHARCKLVVWPSSKRLMVCTLHTVTVTRCRLHGADMQICQAASKCCRAAAR